MKNFLIILSFISLTFCREEILEPYNPAGNVNQPFQETKLNYVNLVFTGEKFSAEFDVELNFNSSESRILISVVDRKEGNVTVNILNENNSSIYKATIETEVPNLIDRIRGNIPNVVKINCSQFSGKFRLQLSKLN